MLINPYSKRRMAGAVLLSWLLLTVFSCGAFAAVDLAKTDPAELAVASHHADMPCCDDQLIDFECCDAPVALMAAAVKLEAGDKIQAEAVAALILANSNPVSARAPPLSYYPRWQLAQVSGLPRIHLLNCTFQI
ncbi:hypothetical protein [Oceanicoccus sp. KOV_DT_Chl]|uniref:hypothetical protein n=1 Tax=Oceanicoccus sp. KOV_DT_Chl TaxID=1904639 RepID=UPI000C7A7124|nr:hypothetical protein [Oceanicoccus sp. KOV_DT_Chl]